MSALNHLSIEWAFSVGDIASHRPDASRALTDASVVDAMTAWLDAPPEIGIDQRHAHIRMRRDKAATIGAARFVVNIEPESFQLAARLQTLPNPRVAVTEILFDQHKVGHFLLLQRLIDSGRHGGYRIIFFEKRPLLAEKYVAVRPSHRQRGIGDGFADGIAVALIPLSSNNRYSSSAASRQQGVKSRSPCN